MFIVETWHAVLIKHEVVLGYIRIFMPSWFAFLSANMTTPKAFTIRIFYSANIAFDACILSSKGSKLWHMHRLNFFIMTGPN